MNGNILSSASQIIPQDTIEDAAWLHDGLGEYYLDKAIEAIGPADVETFSYYYVLFLREVSIFQCLMYSSPAPFLGEPKAPRAISAVGV